MGGREVGGLANTLASHLEFGNPESYALVSDYWQTTTLAKEPGLKAVDMFDAIADGKVKAVWIMATNPAASLPNAEKVRAALEQCDFVVVSDCIADTDTGKLAHVLLPAQGWAEKSGTVTNSERRISRQRRIIEPLGQAKADWWIMCEVAKRMGFETAFSYQHEADIFREYAQMTTVANLANERDLSLETLCHKSQQQYDDLQPVQWPARDSSPETERLFSSGDFYTPDRKGRFIALQYRAPATKVSGDYPFALNTGRIRDQWHTMTRTGLAARLGGHIPEPFVAINPTDAAALGIEQDAIVQLQSDYGTALGRADITGNVATGQLFMPIHWTGSHSAKGTVSAVVSPEFDALSGQPESKFTPVALTPWDHASQGWLLVREPIDKPEWDYWVMQRVEGGYLYSIAGQLPAQALADELKTYCAGERAGTTLDFSDAARGSHRYCHYNDDTLSSAFMVASRLTSGDKDWATELLSQSFELDARRSLLAGHAIGDLARGKLICACKQVGSKLLQETAASENITCVAALSEATSAGTGCGSCLPELEQFLSE
jgi:assimilatory nitrate reductase catalytic subunit